MVDIGIEDPRAAARTPAGPVPAGAATDPAPFATALARWSRRRPARFTVPGHKGGAAAPAVTRLLLGARALALDLPTLIEGVDVARRAESPLRAAERRAAEAWGAARTFFLVNGASQGNHAACLAAGRAGGPVVVQRSSHVSTFDGLALAGLETRFVAPEVDAARGIALCVTPEALDEALTATPGARAAFVVSPTYHGATADVRGLAAVAHRHGAALVVDEAWGAHLAFSALLPEDALHAGADLVVSSTHKHLGSLTGSAMLHLGDGAPAWLDDRAVATALGLVSSTSPSSLLRASLDAARRRAQADGSRLLAQAVADLAVLREEVRAIPGLGVMDWRDAGRPGMAGHDPLRLCVDVTATGLTGWELARRLRVADDVHLELCEAHVVVAVFGLGESVPASGARLVTALRRAAQRGWAQNGCTGAARPGGGGLDGTSAAGVRANGSAVSVGVDGSPQDPPAAIAQTSGASVAPVVSLRAAVFGRSVTVDVADAVGAIAAEALTPYPPGIPVVLPGERLDAARVAALQGAVAAGAVLRGAEDPTLRRIRVLARPGTS